MAILSGIVEHGKLVSKRKWEHYVARLKKQTILIVSGKQKAKKQLEEKLVLAVSSRLPKKRFGIFFSGGVDSTLIAFLAKKMKGDFVCYAVGLKDSKDIEAARKTAKKLNLRLKYKIYSIPEAEVIIKKAVKLVGVNVVSVGVASVEIAAAKLAKKDKIKTFFGGLGSEEIFAGYQRHAEAKDVNEECWKGLNAMYGRDFIRDSKVAAAMKINFLLPYMDKELILAAMAIPAEYKINKNEKKIILRETAVSVGLPRQFAFRKKLAAQYGSGFDKAIEKLAKKNGFKYKKDYLKSLL